jgi:hypothetical protein
MEMTKGKREYKEGEREGRSTKKKKKKKKERIRKHI